MARRGLVATLFLLACLTAAAPDAAADQANVCKTYPCGSCCTKDRKQCCDWRFPGTLSVQPGEPVGGVEAAMDSLARAWGMTRGEALMRVALEQREIVLQAAADAQAQGLDAAARKLFVQQRLKAHEDRLLGRLLDPPQVIQEAAPATGKGAMLGGLLLVAVLALGVVVQWVRGLARTLRPA